MNLKILTDIFNIPECSDKKEHLIEPYLELLAQEIDDQYHKKLFIKMIELYAETNASLKTALEDVQRLSVTDPLTQIYNRLKFMDMLNHEKQRFQRLKHHIGLVLFDIDHFKNVNDTYGHPAGDSVLKELSSIVSSKIRNYDTFARWGGEEFILLLPEISKKNALSKAEELRSCIDLQQFKTVGHITCSFGVTIFLQQDSIENFIQRADDALYLSKHNGRNRVSFK